MVKIKIGKISILVIFYTSKEEERKETEGNRRQREKISKPALESVMRDGMKKESLKHER